ncbi:uncharacterized protein LOC135109174 isoform X2 [Scylla paramamosain]|uniref:uncharacterized protein LOC135109174 isoform X2 n=1 Tax=Scylla paramamosain TaxID=85552 RepID=UPI0030832668
MARRTKDGVEGVEQVIVTMCVTAQHVRKNLSRGPTTLSLEPTSTTPGVSQRPQFVPAVMAWRVGWLLVGVWAWSAGGVPRPSPPRPFCDVEALRCDIICSFPDLGFHCSRCARRPMRFGKRGGDNPALPYTSSSSPHLPGAPRLPAEAPPQPDALDGLRFVGRPHLFLSKIFWRDTVEENVLFRERKLRLWRDRKKCHQIVDDPSRCQDNAFTRLFRSFEDQGEHSHEAGEPNESPCAVDPRKCAHGNDIRKRLAGTDKATRPSFNDHSLRKRSHSSANLSNRSRTRGERPRDSEKHKRHRNFSNKPPERLHHTGGVSSAAKRHPFSPGRRRSRRSVVEEVVEGLMEMLDLEVLPVNPKHYGCHDLPFPGLD